MVVIGITGTIGAGKGTVVEVLKEMGYVHLSVRDFLVKEIKKRKMPVNRDSMLEVGNDLRNQHTSSYIVESLYNEALKVGKNCVIESVRTIGEVKKLKTYKNFYLLSIDADINKRYERIVARQSETDNVSFDTFVSNEQREMSENNESKPNIKACIERANFKLQNNTNKEDLKEKVKQIVCKIESGNCYIRPTWDEYFLDVLKAVSKRATCDRGRSGCVIARNNQILVTGYVGSPIGFPHCDDVGHLMKKTIHDDGTITNHCVRTVHAEQNAICQAAKMGISINGATLYCKMTPCRTCAMLIINCGISRVVCEKKYHAGKESEEMFKQAGVTLEYVENEFEKYENQ